MKYLVRFLVEEGFFFLRNVQLPLKGSFSRERSGRDVKLITSLPAAEVNNGWNYTFASHMCLHGDSGLSICLTLAFKLLIRSPSFRGFVKGQGEYFSRGIHALPKRWNTCMERNGDYIGK